MSEIEEAAARHAESLRRIKLENERPAVDGEEMVTVSSSHGEFRMLRRRADAITEWVRAKTALRDARRKAEQP